MQKWEYTALVSDQALVHELNNMGQEGWEAIFLTKDLVDEKGVSTVIFKRPITQ